MSAAAPPPPPDPNDPHNHLNHKSRCNTNDTTASSASSSPSRQLGRSKTHHEPDQDAGAGLSGFRREPLEDITNFVLTRSSARRRRASIEDNQPVAGPSHLRSYTGGSVTQNTSVDPPRTPASRDRHVITSTRRGGGHALRRTQSEQLVSSTSSSSPGTSIGSSPMTSWAGSRLDSRMTRQSNIGAGTGASAGPQVLADEIRVTSRPLNSTTTVPHLRRRSSVRSSTSTPGSAPAPAPPRGVGLRRTRSSMPRLLPDPGLLSPPRPSLAPLPLPLPVAVLDRTLTLDGREREDEEEGGEVMGRRLRRRRTEGE